MTVENTTPPGGDAGNQPGAGDNTPPAGGDNGGGEPPKAAAPEPNVPDGANWDDATKDYIKRLRTESADRRTKAKDLETRYNDLNTEVTTLKTGLAQALGIDTEATPEQQIEALSHQSQSFESENALLHLMLEKGIKSEGKDYFMFLMEKRASELGENEELTDDMITQIVGEVQAKGGGVTTPVGSGTTSVGNDGQGAKPPAGGNGKEVTIQEFSAMNISERSQLYTTNPNLYSSLMTQYAQTV